MDANQLFDAFVAATSFTKIQQLFSQLCALLDIDPYDNFNVFRRYDNYQSRNFVAFDNGTSVRKEFPLYLLQSFLFLH